jgi:hypothetical protein
LFLEHLAPFVEEGSIEWSGEDHEYWKHIFKNKQLVYKRGVIKYV